MVGDDIELAFKNRFMAEPLADIPHIAFEIQVRITQFDACVGDIHLAIRVLEVNRRDIDGFRQTLRHVQFSILEIDLQPRIPLEQFVFALAVIASGGFEG